MLVATLLAAAGRGRLRVLRPPARLPAILAGRLRGVTSCSRASMDRRALRRRRRPAYVPFSEAAWHVVDSS